jgi:CRISPR/Cas system CSM-associated protein Csm3 (group 7 of RAMP superfamily)
VDLFPQRKLDLEERTGTSSVPQVFFNESFLGGIDELNAMENKKELDEKLKEVYENECPSTAPPVPTYGEDEPLDLKLDEFAEVFGKLKEKVAVKDRFYKMRLFTRCFPAAEALEVFTEDQYCEKEEVS